MTKDQQQRLSAKAEAEKLLSSVFIKKPVKGLINRPSGFAAVFGKTNTNQRAEHRLGKDRGYAQAVIEEWNNALAQGDHSAADAVMTADKMRNHAALQDLKDLGVSIREVVDYYKENAIPPEGVITVDQAVEIYMKEQRLKKLRETSTSESHTNYKTYFKPFREKFKTEKLVNISAAKARSYFSIKGKNWNPTSWNAHRTRLISFWNELGRLGYASEKSNPFKKVTRQHRPRNQESKKVVSLENIIIFWEWLEQEVEKHPSKHPELAYYILTDFCGARPDEARRAQWEWISSKAEDIGPIQNKDFTTSSISFVSERTKNEVSKVNYIPFNAQQWLQIVIEHSYFTKGTELTISDEKNSRQRLKRLRNKFKKETGIEREQNSDRHTFGSNHLSLYQDASLTAYRMGHRDNPKVLWDWYATTLSQAKAKTYFDIVPKRYELEMELLESHQQQEKIRAAQDKSNIGKVTFNPKTGEPEPVQDKRYVPFTDLPYSPTLETS
tara:strand:+ start:654 stop:2144 length:1491 start_codon:yes stop_codon:yes gene_type:complete